MISVYTCREAAIPKTEVNTCIPGSCGLPLELIVIRVRADRGNQLVTEVVVASELAGIGRVG